MKFLLTSPLILDISLFYSSIYHTISTDVFYRIMSAIRDNNNTLSIDTDTQLTGPSSNINFVDIHSLYEN